MKHTFNQIFSTLSKAVKDNSRINYLLQDIANAPFKRIILKAEFTCVIENGKVYHIPIHIKAEYTNTYKAILKEVAHKIFKFGELYYYDNEDHKLNITDVRIDIEEAYSYYENGKLNSSYAIFHKEQECGNSWLVINTGNLTAPISYIGDETVREETNDVTYYTFHH